MVCRRSIMYNHTCLFSRSRNVARSLYHVATFKCRCNFNVRILQYGTKVTKQYSEYWYRKIYSTQARLFHAATRYLLNLSCLDSPGRERDQGRSRPLVTTIFTRPHPQYLCSLILSWFHILDWNISYSSCVCGLITWGPGFYNDSFHDLTRVTIFGDLAWVTLFILTRHM